MEVLSSCFEEKKTAEASRQMSLVNCHQFLSTNQIFIQGIPRECSTFLCQKVFEAALDRLWPCRSSESILEAAKLRHEVQSCDHDIISYIGGAVLKKLIDKYKDNHDFCKALTAFCAPKDQVDGPPQSLTAMRDRGGLIYLRSDAFDTFRTMESIFLATDFGAGDENTESFIGDCREQLNEKVSEFLRNVLEEESDVTSDLLLKKMSKKYFKIRIHHRAFVLMESYKAKKHTEKRSKALRKQLKMKDFNSN